MDPLTILTTASAVISTATSLIKNIADFIEQAREVDSTVEDLYTDIRNVQGALQSIAFQIDRVSKDQSQTGSDELWVWVRDSLNECDNTLISIHSELVDIGLKPSQNIAGRAVKTYRLNARAGQIKELRERVKWNQSTLHLVLDMIIIQTLQHQGHSSEESMKDLSERIEALQTDLNYFKKFARRFRRSDSIVNGGQELATHILSSARTEYSAWSTASQGARVPLDRTRSEGIRNWRDKTHRVPPGRRNSGDSGLGRSVISSSISDGFAQRIVHSHNMPAGFEGWDSSTLTTPTKLCQKKLEQAEAFYVVEDLEQAAKYYEATKSSLSRFKEYTPRTVIDVTTLDLCIAVTKLGTGGVADQMRECEGTYRRIVTPDFLKDLSNKIGPCSSDKVRRQLLVADHSLQSMNLGDAEKWYFSAMQNIHMEGIHPLCFARATVAWSMMEFVQGNTLDAEVLSECSSEYIKRRLDSFGRRKGLITGSSPKIDHKLLVNPAIRARDFEVVFLALYESQTKDINWTATRQSYTRPWLIAALASKLPVMVKLLFRFDVDVNTRFTFTPAYSFGSYSLQSFSVNALFISIAESKYSKDMEKIALMCIERGAAWELDRDYQTSHKNNRNGFMSRIAGSERSTNVTALHYAAYVDNEHIIAALKVKGAKLKPEAWVFDNNANGGKRRAVTHTPGDVAYWRRANNAAKALRANAPVGANMGIQSADAPVLNAVYGGLSSAVIH